MTIFFFLFLQLHGTGSPLVHRYLLASKIHINIFVLVVRGKKQTTFLFQYIDGTQWPSLLEISLRK